MTTNDTGSSAMKTETRMKRSQKLRSAAVERLTGARRDVEILMGYAFMYEWLAREMDNAERRIEQANRAFGVPIEAEERDSEELADELQAERDEVAKLRSALAHIAETGGGSARMIARQALGMDMAGARVVDVMDGTAIAEEEMPGPPTMQ